jgi:hypothetical protein
MNKKILRFAVPGVVAVAGLSGVFLSEGEKNCKDLVAMSNEIVEAGNEVSTPAQVDAFMPKLVSSATEIRGAAADYKAPFDADARATATALDAIGAALTQKDEAAYDAAITRFNATVDATNEHCDNA